MPVLNLHGQTALITGAAKRIGRAIALALAGEGVNIVVHYRGSSSEASDLCAELQAMGVKCWTVQADFGNQEEYSTLVQRATATAGSLEILVNNASIFPPDRLENATFDHLMQNVEVNAWAPFVLCREFSHVACHGSIINLLDTRVTGYDWSHVSYILSKHLLSEFTRMMALDYAPDMRVNAVAPGLILPPPGQDVSYLQRLVDTVPLKRHGEAEDIARAVVFLAKNDFITGQTLYVDGGRHLKESRNG